MIDTNFKEKELELMDFYSDNERTEFNQKYSLSVAVGVGLILFGVVLQILIDNLYNEDLANAIFMVLVTIAVAIFVYYGCLKGKYDAVDEKKIEQEKQNKKPIMWSGIIMMIATVIYLAWSFTANAWRISWIVYPIGGILCGIIWMFFIAHKKD